MYQYEHCALIACDDIQGHVENIYWVYQFWRNESSGIRYPFLLDFQSCVWPDLKISIELPLVQWPCNAWIIQRDILAELEKVIGKISTLYSLSRCSNISHAFFACKSFSIQQVRGVWPRLWNVYVNKPIFQIERTCCRFLYTTCISEGTKRFFALYKNRQCFPVLIRETAVHSDNFTVGQRYRGREKIKSLAGQCFKHEMSTVWR